MKEKWLGKITEISLGYGGYQDAMFGLSVVIEGEWGVHDFKGTWGVGTEITKNTQWTEADRSKNFDDVMRYINKLLIDAKVKYLDELKGKPIEVTSENLQMKSWRILTEVI